MQNYQNKSSVISPLLLSLLSRLSSDAHSYTKFLKLKSTDENAQNIILLYCYKNLRLERESRFPFSEKYFIFLKWFLNLTGTIKGVERGQLTGENSVCTININIKLSTKKSYWIPRGSCVFYYFYIIQQSNSC